MVKNNNKSKNTPRINNREQVPKVNFCELFFSLGLHCLSSSVSGMVVPSKTKIVCHFSTLVLTCGQPHTLQIVPRDEYDNPTNNSMSLRDEHNYTLSIHEVSAFSFPYARKLGSLLGTSLPALVFPLTLEPSRLYFIVHVCLGSVRHRLKEPGQALMKHMESHFASCSSVLKKTRTMKSHLRSR